jgi:hypothetical protein
MQVCARRLPILGCMHTVAGVGASTRLFVLLVWHAGGAAAVMMPCRKTGREICTVLWFVFGLYRFGSAALWCSTVAWLDGCSVLTCGQLLQLHMLKLLQLCVAAKCCSPSVHIARSTFSLLPLCCSYALRQQLLVRAVNIRLSAVSCLWCGCSTVSCGTHLPCKWAAFTSVPAMRCMCRLMLAKFAQVACVYALLREHAYLHQCAAVPCYGGTAVLLPCML